MVQRSMRDIAYAEPSSFQNRPVEGTRLDQILADLKARPRPHSAPETDLTRNVTPLNTPLRAEVQSLQASIDQLAHRFDGQRLADAIADLSERVEALHTDRSLGEAEMRLLRSIRRSLDDLIYQMNLMQPQATEQPVAAVAAPIDSPPSFGRRAEPLRNQGLPLPRIEEPRIENLPFGRRPRSDQPRSSASTGSASTGSAWSGTQWIRRYPLASVAAAACFAIFLAQGLGRYAPKMSDITGSIRTATAPNPKPPVPGEGPISAPPIVTVPAQRQDYASAPQPLAPPVTVPSLAPAPPSMSAPSRTNDEIGGLAAYQAGIRLSEGPARDYRGAIQMFEKAGDLPAAQFRLALLYERGQGAPKNPTLARALYQKAAERGHVRAMHNLGVLYADGVDGRPDYAMAAEWFRRAAEYGLRDSEYNLATLTARGLGVEKRPANAYTWFALAAAQGDADAARQRDEIGKTLDAASLKAAKAAAENFRPKPIDPQVNQTAS